MPKSLIPVTTIQRPKRTRFISRRNTYIQPKPWQQLLIQPHPSSRKVVDSVSLPPRKLQLVSQSLPPHQLHVDKASATSIVPVPQSFPQHQLMNQVDKTFTRPLPPVSIPIKQNHRIPRVANIRRAKTIQPFQFHPSVEIKQPQPKQVVQQPFYRGNDLHAYTPYLQTRLSTYINDFKMNYPQSVQPQEWISLMTILQDKYGNDVTPALNNISQYYNSVTGSIQTPELPGMNFAVVLMALWNYIVNQSNEDQSLSDHFKQTLQDIGTTCLAGVTDRLFADWIAFHPL